MERAEQAIAMGVGCIRPILPRDLRRVRLIIGSHINGDDRAALVSACGAAVVDEGSPPRHRMHIAELDQRIVGLIAMLGETRDAASLFLIVEPSGSYTGAIGQRLGEIMLGLGRRQGVLKIANVLTPGLCEVPQGLFTRYGYQPHRVRGENGHRRVEYFLDIYHDPEVDAG